MESVFGSALVLELKRLNPVEYIWENFRLSFKKCFEKLGMCVMNLDLVLNLFKKLKTNQQYPK
jgi:hypothetical protein